MSDAEVLAEIRRALEAIAPSRAAEIRAVASCDDLDALGLDSITMLELIDFLEKRLEVAFSDDFVLELEGSRDLVAAIQKLASEKESSGAGV